MQKLVRFNEYSQRWEEWLIIVHQLYINIRLMLAVKSTCSSLIYIYLKWWGEDHHHVLWPVCLFSSSRGRTSQILGDRQVVDASYETHSLLCWVLWRQLHVVSPTYMLFYHFFLHQQLQTILSIVYFVLVLFYKDCSLSLNVDRGSFRSEKGFLIQMSTQVPTWVPGAFKKSDKYFFGSNDIIGIGILRKNFYNLLHEAI